MAAIDRWAGDASYAGGVLGPFTGPATHANAITPSDTLDVTYATRALYIGVGGNVKVTMISGDVVTLTGVVAGTMLPIRVTRVWATGTSASSMTGLD